MADKIKIKEGLEIVVDSKHYLMLHKLLDKRYHSIGYYGTSKKYATLRIQIPIHHLIVGIENIKTGMVVDHINGDSQDCRKENLRICTQSQNLFNMKPPRKGHYKGVYKIPSGRYQAKLSNKKDKVRKQICIGTYDTEKEAALAYNNKAIEIYGEYACLNVIK